MSQRLTVVVALALLGCGPLSQYACATEANSGEAILKELGLGRGIAVVLGDEQCQLAVELAKRSDLTLYVRVSDATQFQAACKAADAAGLYGTRIFLEKQTSSRIGLADNLADAVIAHNAAAAEKSEILRVLRPGGRAAIGDQRWTKPWPAGVDAWTHHYHGPDNNPQSRDQLARAPYLTQFVAEPRYAPAPQAVVSAGGRLFMAFGHVAWHQREEAWLNTLVAVNGFNGTMLWKQPLPQGVMVDRSTIIATDSTLFLAGAKSCQMLDPATGQVTGEITVPKDVAGGTFWKWIALGDGVLYGLIGDDEPADPDARWRSTGHGWPWTGISSGYNADEYRWGFGSTLAAVDPATKKVLWRHRDDPPIDSRSLCLRNGRLYFCSFGKYVTCLDAASGKAIWRKTPQRDPDVFQAIGPYRPGHGYIGGWKSTVYLKCTDKALYFVGPQVEWLTALSTDDGYVLWRHPVKDLHVVVRDDGLYVIGAQNSSGETKKLDPLSGRVLATYPTHRRACTRSVGTVDSILFRAQEGTGRLNLASGAMSWISPMRPSCHIGVLVAAGQLYWVPWACDCDLQLFGVISCGPAGDFDFTRSATEAQRLEKPSGGTDAVASLSSTIRDWPTYRANNQRTGQTEATLPGAIRLAWEAKLPTACEPTAPVAIGGLVFLGGSDGIVRALDAKSGRVRWKAYTGGAIQFPPTISDGRALVGSGDGWAYCLEAGSGRTLWRFQAAPESRKIAMYQGLVSTWPVASGVLVEKGIACFAAGINDFDGTHVYALDVASGRIVWQNHASGQLDSASPRGVACQGDLLLHQGRLYLAGGNAVSPGLFDMATGRCLNVAPTSMGSTAPRGRELTLVSDSVRVVGQPLYSRPEAAVLSPDVQWDNAVIRAANARLEIVSPPSPTGKRAPPGPKPGGKQTSTTEGAAVASDASQSAPAERPTVLVARDLDSGRNLWSQELPSAPVRWGVAVDSDGRIIVCLRNGRVLCYAR